MNLKSTLYAAILYASFCFSLPVQDASTEIVSPELPRLVIYFQTTHDAEGNPISMLPLITEQNISLTHLIVCSFHINLNNEIHLNDYPPDNPLFYTLWNETVIMKEAGVKVMGMVGGAAAGSFTPSTLDSTDNTTFEHYYGQLHDVIVDYGLQGMDLDVEQSMSQAGITRLVTRLYADFGQDFIITLAPVASALYNGGNLSGFNYENLEAASVTESGTEMITFYNAQFYSGFGSMSSPSTYEKIVANGWDPTQIVAGQLTSPSNGYGYTSIPTLNQTVIDLMEEYGMIGGIMGWEYFNSDPGGTAAPWEWAQEMTEILRPNYTVQLTVTTETAKTLEQAWRASVKEDALGQSPSVQGEEADIEPTVNYFTMINA
ncbi:Chitinase 1 [Cytospora mali]|uniref:Chitinase 1 n=1 Tax=Cytospora mali TaxID=578113 RepID=A0A194VQM2_CYTMA|nr:Chitinase 1 [Valsa mali]